MTQIEYYNNFGLKYKDDIMNELDPSIWTSDIKINGPIFRKMKKRIEIQRKYFLEYFTPQKPILDIGCGFGRQSYILARNGFSVTGIDNSDVFIDIAKAIFAKHNLQGTFLSKSLFDFIPSEKFDQIVVLDVIEHIEPERRFELLKHIAQDICNKNAKILFTFPSVDSSFKRKIIDLISNRFLLQLNKEHPYCIPSKRDFDRISKNLFTTISHEVCSETVFLVSQVR